MTIKNVKVKTKISSKDYVNNNTGELLDTEFKDTVSINRLIPTLKIIDSKEYVVIDSEALRIVSTKFTASDMGRVLQMSDMVFGQFNILTTTQSDERLPHTDKTLSIAINYNSANKYKRFMDKLFKAGVISYLYSYVKGEKVKFILFNPYLARKSKTFDIECLETFSRFLTENELRN